MQTPGQAPVELIDLHHLARAHVIGTWRVGDVLVDPGPASCLQTLLPWLDEHPPRVIALTHIHLDHAGATGSLVRRFPDAEVWVHERGASHVIDPSRLLASATRLYGDHMQRLWGEVLPVAGERVRALRGGETLGHFRVRYTPGHASHHVAFLHEPSGYAFTGDLTGVRIQDGPVMAPTPPPDIDLEAWRASLQLIRHWSPRSLAITHFGAHHDVGGHLGALEEHLDAVEALAREGDEAKFASVLRARIAKESTPATASVYEQAMPAAQGFQGLQRYLHRS
ncbi:MAG TPA: MBL fold metallo-hydrolase [Solirubrobacteraceae bacterium]|jgi:glyoxylase-like metal-dependent hydrolase (beta-lactamase superfamily II)